MTTTIYTAVTFAPVQGFIEKSRKLRDLYGSSLLLSFMAEVICRGVEESRLVSPALVDNAKGTPNQILVSGQYPEAQELFTKTWKIIVKTCQTAIEETYLPGKSYCWDRSWQAWANYTWEFFSATDTEINNTRTKLSQMKRERGWIGINWQGESSSLSGYDGVAWPGMDKMNPEINYDHEVNLFWQDLAMVLPKSIIDIGNDQENSKGEQLSIPELLKRLILLEGIKDTINQKVNDLLDHINLPNQSKSRVFQLRIKKPDSFKELNRKENNEWTGWFMGDGDKMGEFIQAIGNEQNKLYQFSLNLIKWGKSLESELDDLRFSMVDHRIVYAGGDDFFGILSASDEFKKTQQLSQFTTSHCLSLIYSLHDNLWVKKLSDMLKQEFSVDKNLTASIGFVWAAPNVPQRDVLQHCRETEKLAKDNGRDRLAIRILFNSGNHLDWHCPWWFLQKVLTDYRDRGGGTNWTHFYNDVAVLEARRAFPDASSEVAQGLFDIYFPNCLADLTRNTPLDNHESKTAILTGSNPKTLNKWITNLAKVGFHIYG